MKRSRDDDSHPVKRPLDASRGESYGQSQNTGVEAGGTKLTTDDALHYLKEVKIMFQDQRDKYDQFLDVMKEFKAQRINTEGVIARVKELFKGHNNLIYGFNTFLPKGYEITLDEDDPRPRKVEFEEAIEYVNKIKKRFENDEHVYVSFLDILNMYRRDDKNIGEVYVEITELFEDHPDLLEEFAKFLPDNSATTSVPHAQQERSTFPRHDDRGTPMLPLRRVLSDDQHWRQERVSTSHVERDLGVSHADLDEQRAAVKSHKDQRKREKESRDRRNRNLDNRAPGHDVVRELNSPRYSEKRKPAQREGFPSVSYDDRNALKSIYSQEFTFCERVKEKLGSSDDYQAFLKCLHIYSTEIITRTELQSLVADLLGKYPDLMEGFNEFLERCENIDGFLAGVMSKRSLWSDRHLTRSSKTDDKDKESKRDTEGAKERREKYWKSIQDLDLSKCQRCTPSYRLLPDDYPIYTASQRSELGAQVLNDHWVSVTSGSEDYSFKHMRRNQYEESLFKCEDDRFELDMLIESVSSTAKRAEDLLNNINHNKSKTDVSIRIEDHFTAINLRCIERIYGDHGLDTIDALRKLPAQSLPAILNRLKQKQEEWTRCRSAYNKIWAEIFAKNHYKSLDHRSFYFKQQDSKILNVKSLVAEIMERKENIQKDDNLLFSVAAAYKRPLVPHLELFFPDAGVHKDIRKIVKFSCEELCSTKEQLNKVMKLWYTFFEPMLGVLCQPRGADNAEDGHRIAWNGSSGSMEIDASAAVSKQLEHMADANDNFLGAAKSCQMSTLNGNATARELGSNESNTSHKDDVLSAMEITSGAQLSLPVASNYSGDLHERKRSFDAKQLEVVTASKGTRPGGTEVKRHQEETAGRLKSEKEEGELSPNGDFEEDNSSVCWDASMLAPEATHGADVDDEESENASEASGGESGDDECSREDHEEEEDVENDELSGKAESGSDTDVHHNGQRFLMNVRPLKRYVSSEIEYTDKKFSRVFYGNDSFYILFRLHSMLYERILTAKLSSASSDAERKDSKETSCIDPYSSFMSALFSLLDGSSDNAKYEDDCRAIIGKQAYVLSTLDRLIYKLVKQLQTVATDELENKLLQLYEYEKSRKPMKSNDSVYHENARVLLHDENIYRIDCSSTPAQLSIQLMDREYDKPEMFAVSVEPKFSAYLQNDFLSIIPCKKEPCRIFLNRNKRRYADLDENSAVSLAMEDVQLLNGLEYKMFCSTSKIFYVLDTEDFFYQPSSKRSKLSDDQRAKLNLARVRRFRKKLPSS